MGDHYQKRAIESEMDRFEKEISSLASAPTTSFIPAQLRRPAHPPPGTGRGSSHGLIASASTTNRPSPVIISGAPQVYSAIPKGLKPVTSTSGTITAKPTLVSQQQSTLGSTDPSAPSTSNLIPKTAFPGSSGIPIPNVNAPAAASSSTSNPSISQPSMLADPPIKSSTSMAEGAEKKKKKKKKKVDGQEKKPKKALRSAGGQIWEDTTLQDWDPSGFRLFCGDLGNDVTDEVLTRVFGRFPSFQKAKVVRDKRSNKTKGFGFVSFKDPNDFVRAIKELDGKYVGSRPIKLRKSNWRNRNLDQARKKDKERTQILAQIKK